MKACYSTMIFEHAPGVFTANVTIAVGFKDHWTSPETKLEATNLEDARVEAMAKLRVLRRACEMED